MRLFPYNRVTSDARNQLCSNPHLIPRPVECTIIKVPTDASTARMCDPHCIGLH